jgi:hypothetical protein
VKELTLEIYGRTVKNGEGFVTQTPILVEMSNGGGANYL